LEFYATSVRDGRATPAAGASAAVVCVTAIVRKRPQPRSDLLVHNSPGYGYAIHLSSVHHAIKIINGGDPRAEWRGNAKQRTSVNRFSAAYGMRIIMSMRARRNLLVRVLCARLRARGNKGKLFVRLRDKRAWRNKGIRI